MRPGTMDRQAAIDCAGWRAGHNGGDADPCRDLSHSSCVVAQRRLAALAGHLLAEVGYFGTHLEPDPLNAAPDRKIATQRAPRRWRSMIPHL